MYSGFLALLFFLLLAPAYALTEAGKKSSKIGLLSEPTQVPMRVLIHPPISRDESRHCLPHINILDAMETSERSIK